jgi:hypothetical protein
VSGEDESLSQGYGHIKEGSSLMEPSDVQLLGPYRRWETEYEDLNRRRCRGPKQRTQPRQTDSSHSKGKSGSSKTAQKESNARKPSPVPTAKSNIKPKYSSKEPESVSAVNANENESFAHVDKLLSNNETSAENTNTPTEDDLNRTIAKQTKKHNKTPTNPLESTEIVGKFIHWVSAGSTVILGLADEFNVDTAAGGVDSRQVAVSKTIPVPIRGAVVGSHDNNVINYYGADTADSSNNNDRGLVLASDKNFVNIDRKNDNKAVVLSNRGPFFSYSWFRNDLPIRWADNRPFLMLNNVNSSLNGKYRCVRTVSITVPTKGEGKEKNVMSLVSRKTLVDTHLYVTGM